MRTYIILLLLLAMATAVSAADINLIEPRDGQTVESSTRFTFTVESGEIIDTCSLIVDDEVSRTAQYNSNLRGRTLSFAIVGEDGLHNWTVSCTTPAGLITAQTAEFTLDNPENLVTVKSSGVTRGSMVHIFTIENSADQEPILVPRVATGDYIEVSLDIPPSTITKEFYVRQRTVRNDTPTLWVTFRQEDYYLPMEQNVTLNMSSTARVIASFTGIESNRNNLLFFPAVQAASEETPAETPAEQIDEPMPEEPAAPSTPPAEEPAEQEPVEPAAPRQSLFKRFLSWLTGIFGA